MSNSKKSAPAVVWALETELNGPLAAYGGEYEVTGDFDGISSVHLTLEGALAAFDKWLARNGISKRDGYEGVTTHDTFVGGETEIVNSDGDIDVLVWGINKKEVQA